MQTIAISTKTYRRLQRRAIPFVDQDAESVIVRLLDQTRGMSAKAERTHNPHDHEPSDLVTRTGSIPHGSKLRATYMGGEYFAEIDDGKVVWNGRRFKSLSRAAVAIMQSSGSDRTTENGWRFFEVQLPEKTSWVPAKMFRTRRRRH